MRTIAKHLTGTCGQTLLICLIGVTSMTGAGVTPATGAGMTQMTGAGVTSMTDRTLIGTHQLNPHELTLKGYAKQKVQTLWTNRQWPCMKQIVWLESRWQPDAYNPNTTAYGLGQLIGSRKYLQGKPYKQITKMMQYIAHRYPTDLACEALAHHHRWAWY